MVAHPFLELPDALAKAPHNLGNLPSSKEHEDHDRENHYVPRAIKHGLPAFHVLLLKTAQQSTVRCNTDLQYNTLIADATCYVFTVEVFEKGDGAFPR